MNPYQNALVIQAQAAMVQVESMKVENKMREIRQESPAYGEDCFLIVVQTLEKLARDLLNS